MDYSFRIRWGRVERRKGRAIIYINFNFVLLCVVCRILGHCSTRTLGHNNFVLAVALDFNLVELNKKCFIHSNS